MDSAAAPALDGRRPHARNSAAPSPDALGTLTLDALPLRRRAEIVAVDWAALAPDEAKRLQALGIDEGARVAIAHRGIFAGHDPIALMVGRTVIALRRSHARAMTVEFL